MTFQPELSRYRFYVWSHDIASTCQLTVHFGDNTKMSGKYSLICLSICPLPLSDMLQQNSVYLVNILIQNVKSPFKCKVLYVLVLSFLWEIPDVFKASGHFACLFFYSKCSMFSSNPGCVCSAGRVAIWIQHSVKRSLWRCCSRRQFLFNSQKPAGAGFYNRVYKYVTKYI